MHAHMESALYSFVHAAVNSDLEKEVEVGTYVR